MKINSSAIFLKIIIFIVLTVIFFEIGIDENISKAFTDEAVFLENTIENEATGEAQISFIVEEDISLLGAINIAPATEFSLDDIADIRDNITSFTIDGNNATIGYDPIGGYYARVFEGIIEIAVEGDVAIGSNIEITFDSNIIDTNPANSGTYIFEIRTFGIDPGGMGYVLLEEESVNVEITEEIVFYTLTYSASANGTIDGDTPQSVAHGENGTEVTAIPNANYHFIEWSDSVLTTSRTDTNITADLSVMASFAIDTHAVTFQDYDTTELKVEEVNHGGSATSPTDPERTGYAFVGWDVTYDNITTDLTVTAEYTINNYTATYSAGANGTIEGDTLQAIEYGEDGTEVTAFSDEGYHFVDWSDDVLTAVRTDTNVTDDISVTANFAIDDLNIPGKPEKESQSDDQIEISWSENSNSTITQYYAKNVTTDEGSGWIIENSWTSEDLRCGQEYVFKVKARNDIAETDYSQEAEIRTDICSKDLIEIGSIEGLCNSLRLKINIEDEYENEEIDLEIKIENVQTSKQDKVEFNNKEINKDGEIVLNIGSLDDYFEYKIEARFKGEGDYDYSEWSDEKTGKTSNCAIGDDIEASVDFLHNLVDDFQKSDLFQEINDFQEKNNSNTDSQLKNNFTEIKNKKEKDVFKEFKNKSMERIAKAKIVVEENKKKMAVVSTLGLSASALTISSQLPNFNYIWALFRSIWSFISGFFVKRKKDWGVVFDDNSGKPIFLATVSIYNSEDRKIDSRITDKEGAYNFLVSPGEYYLKIEKEGYKFKSSVLGSNIFYSNQYDGEKIRVEKYDIVKEDVPMKLDKENYEKIQKIFKIKKILMYVFLFSGVIFSFGILILNQNLLNYGICGVYLASMAIGYVISRGDGWATIINEKGKPEVFATIKITDRINGELKVRTITDEKGRYFLILNAGDYNMEVTTVSGKKYKNDFSIKNDREVFRKEIRIL